MVPGWVGTVITVRARLLGVLVPQAFCATTLKVPLLVGIKVQLVPVPTGVPPPL